MLFKLCKQTEKYLFAAGFGIQMLTYYCSTYCNELKVFNGNEKGGLLDDLPKITYEELMKLNKDDYFLDQATGDYFAYKPVIYL